MTTRRSILTALFGGGAIAAQTKVPLNSQVRPGFGPQPALTLLGAINGQFTVVTLGTGLSMNGNVLNAAAAQPAQAGKLTLVPFSIDNTGAITLTLPAGVSISNVLAFRNGVLMAQGAGKDFTIGTRGEILPEPSIRSISDDTWQFIALA